MLLAVDTSTRYAGVALWDDGMVLDCRCWHSKVNHTVELMPAVAAILESRGLKPGDLAGLAIALGPGGFSALRVGMGVVKGLALTSKRPVVGVGTLDLEAHPYLGAGLKVCALLEAGRSEVASALFGPDGRRVREDLVGTIQELAESISGSGSDIDDDEGAILFCGEGAGVWEESIRERFGSKALVIVSSPAARLWALCRMGGRRLEDGESDDLAALQPNYLRMPSIGGPKRRDWTPQQS